MGGRLWRGVGAMGEEEKSVAAGDRWRPRRERSGVTPSAVTGDGDFSVLS